MYRNEEIRKLNAEKEFLQQKIRKQQWAAQTGLVSGYGDGSFGVNDNITVEQLAVMLWNKAGKAASSTTLSESITRSDWASSALNWCSETGVLEQVSFEKADFTATRTHIFQMLANSLNK